MKIINLLLAIILISLCLNPPVYSLKAQENVEEPWFIPITVSVNGFDKHVFLGTKTGATDNYDNSPIDTLTPPAPIEGFYIYFSVSGIPNLTDKLSHDYRSVTKTPNDWILHITQTESQSGTIAWDASNFPTGSYKSGILTINGTDMLTQNSLNFADDQELTIHYETPQDLVTLLLEVNVFLEGPYQLGESMSTTLKSDGVIPLTSPYVDARKVTSIPEGVVDWVMVELRTTKNGGTTQSRSFFLNNKGNVIDYNGIETTTELHIQGLPGGFYYIVVQHRNHLSVMSVDPVSLSSSTATFYDFTTRLDKYYGSDAQLLEEGIYGMFTGDANHNGQIQNDDKNDYWKVQVGLAGYRGADFNLNGQVQNDDKNDFWKNNVGKGTQVPTGG